MPYKSYSANVKPQATCGTLVCLEYPRTGFRTTETLQSTYKGEADRYRKAGLGFIAPYPYEYFILQLYALNIQGSFDFQVLMYTTKITFVSDNGFALLKHKCLRYVYYAVQCDDIAT